MRLLINGIFGRMGRQVYEIAKENGDIIYGVDVNDKALNGAIVRNNFYFNEIPDAIIDFSSPEALESLLEYAVRSCIPTVIGTTGLNTRQRNDIHILSKNYPIFYSQNMSAGINLILSILKPNIFKDWERAITDFHHSAKKDAPGGTALMLSDALGGCNITCIRAGGNCGEHSIIFANEYEEVHITHRALSRRAFAMGAYAKARELVKLKGVQDM